jgi:transcriptional regulator
MEAEKALESIQQILQTRRKAFNSIESQVFIQIWKGKTYAQMLGIIYKSNGNAYSEAYLLEVATKKLFPKIRRLLNNDDIDKFNFKEEIEIFLRNNNETKIFSSNDKEIIDSPQDKPNPFVPTTGRIENLEKFFGREKEIKEIFEFLNNASSVAIIGEQAIGKSSLLYAVYKQSIKFLQSPLQSPRQNVFLDMNNIHNQEDFYFAICEKLGIPGNPGYRFTRNLENKRVLVLLMLDNVGRLNGAGFTRDVRDHLRGLAEGENACLKLVLAANESLKTLFNDSYETSPLQDICQQVDILPWDEEIIREFITKRLQPTTIDFTETDIQELIETSGGHPQKLTELCYDLYKKYSESSI